MKETKHRQSKDVSDESVSAKPISEEENEEMQEKLSEEVKQEEDTVQATEPEHKNETRPLLTEDTLEFRAITTVSLLEEQANKIGDPHRLFAKLMQDDQEAHMKRINEQLLTTLKGKLNETQMLNKSRYNVSDKSDATWKENFSRSKSAYS